MDTDKMKKTFEDCGFVPACFVFHDGKYGIWIIDDDEEGKQFTTGMGFVQAKWESFQAGWQASRQDVVIELTPPHNDYANYSDSEVSGACKYYEQAKKHIHAAGLTTK